MKQTHVQAEAEARASGAMAAFEVLVDVDVIECCMGDISDSTMCEISVICQPAASRPISRVTPDFDFVTSDPHRAALVFDRTCSLLAGLVGVATYAHTAFAAHFRYSLQLPVDVLIKLQDIQRKHHRILEDWVDGLRPLFEPLEKERKRILLLEQPGLASVLSQAVREERELHAQEHAVVCVLHLLGVPGQSHWIHPQPSFVTLDGRWAGQRWPCASFPCG